MTEQIILSPKFTLQDSLKFFYTFLFKSWGAKFAIAIIGLVGVSDLLYFFNILDKELYYPNGISTLNIILPIVTFFVLPITFYYSLKKQFENNYRLKENIKIIIDSNSMNVKGESFNTETPWDKVEAIIEKKSMFLIKQGKIKYGYLMKSYFNQEQLKDFKDIIQAINIKKN
jgi:hypothetical protein